MDQYFRGDGNYSDLRTWKVTGDGAELKIEPIGIPYLSLTIGLIVFITIAALGSQFGEDSSFVRYLFIGGICLSAAVFLGASCFRSAQQLRLGPWLILNHATGLVTLPRSSFSISRSDIEKIGVVSRDVKIGHRSSDVVTHYELHLLYRRDQKLSSIRLIASLLPFDDLVQDLKKRKLFNVEGPTFNKKQLTRKRLFLLPPVLVSAAVLVVAFQSFASGKLSGIVDTSYLQTGFVSVGGSEWSYFNIALSTIAGLSAAVCYSVFQDYRHPTRRPRCFGWMFYLFVAGGIMFYLGS